MFVVLRDSRVVFQAETPGEILAFLDASGSPPSSPIAVLCTADDFRAKHVSPEELTQPDANQTPTER